MAYADYNYYVNTYLGDAIGAEDFPRLARRASEEINAHTLHRARGYFCARPHDRLIRDATCAVAEVVQQSERGNPYYSSEKPVQTEIIGRHHITYDISGNTSNLSGQAAVDLAIRSTIIRYLGHTGLLYRGVAVC